MIPDLRSTATARTSPTLAASRSPPPGDEFIEEIEAITFNTFTLDEAARALANFDAAANPEITIAVFSLAGLNVLGLLFGCWRGTSTINRRREVRRRHQQTDGVSHV